VDKLILVLCFALAPAALVQAESSLNLTALMQSLAAVKTNHVNFVERRESPFLESPLATHGTLSFEAPDKLVRHTTKPIDERFESTGNRVVIERGQPPKRTRQELSLDDLPAIKPFLLGLRATLSGDLAALQQHFYTRLTGTESAWVLTLSPRDNLARSAIREIHFQGSAANLARIEIVENGGDVSRLTLSPP
jgi:outer membrane lipoprotein-sorting protein